MCVRVCTSEEGMGGVVFFQPSFLPSIFVSCLLFQDDKLFIELLDQSELEFHGCLVGQLFIMRSH